MAKNEKHNLKKRGDVWYFIASRNGKRYHESLSTNLREAKQLRDEYLYELKHYGYLKKENRKVEEQSENEGMLLGEVAMLWSERQGKRTKKDDLRSSSFDDYRSSMNCHVLPKFGNIPINDITADDVDDFALSLKCGNTRTNNILAPMRSLFKMAKKKKIIRENIMKDVDNLTREYTEVFPLSPSEVRSFLDHTPPHYKPFFTVLFFTGMRFGEIAALKWKNVELEEGIVKIVETRVRGEEGKPKTRGSVRDIDLLFPVIEALNVQRQMKLKGKYVFRDQKGILMTPDHIREVIWKPILKRADLEYRPPIQTRHTFATMAIETGVELGWVQHMLGHKTLQMIFNNYHRWIKDETKDNGRKMMENLGDSFPQLADAA